jgi:hypothetical protein
MDAGFLTSNVSTWGLLECVVLRQCQPGRQESLQNHPVLGAVVADIGVVFPADESEAGTRASALAAQSQIRILSVLPPLRRIKHCSRREQLAYGWLQRTSPCLHIFTFRSFSASISSFCVLSCTEFNQTQQLAPIHN